MGDPAKVEPVTIIGTGDGGPPLTSGIVAQTPDHLPNLAIRVVTPIVAIGVRFVNTYLTLMAGIVTAGMTSDVLPYEDFRGLLILGAKLAVSGAVVGLIKDVITVFGKLEKQYPLLTGSV